MNPLELQIYVFTFVSSWYEVPIFQFILPFLKLRPFRTNPDQSKCHRIHYIIKLNFSVCVYKCMCLYVRMFFVTPYHVSESPGNRM